MKKYVISLVLITLVSSNVYATDLINQTDDTSTSIINVLKSDISSNISLAVDYAGEEESITQGTVITTFDYGGCIGTLYSTGNLVIEKNDSSSNPGVIND